MANMRSKDRATAMSCDQIQANIVERYNKRMFQSRYRKKCWTCGSDITDLYDQAPREGEDTLLRICLTCHNNLAFKKGSPLELTNMIRYVAGLDPVVFD